MTTYHDLTGFRRDLLQAIAAVEEPYGLGLKAYLDERYSTEIHHSRLYQNLDALTEAGLVTREPIDDRTNGYYLTDEGRSLLAAHAAELVAQEPGECPTVSAAGGGQ